MRQFEQDCKAAATGFPHEAAACRDKAEALRPGGL
jgi:hypothetical protein